MTQIVNLLSALWNPLDSYGRLAQELNINLTRMGVHVNCFGENPPMDRVINPALGGIYVSPATYYQEIGNTFTLQGPRIAITMFEGTHLPPRWIDPLNECDVVIVPACFLVDVLRDNGVNVPIEVVPLGVSEIFTRPVHRKIRPVTTFYVVGDSGGRKAWKSAGFAFMKAFGDSPEFRLIIKARPDALRFRFSNPNVTLLHGEYTDRAMRDLMASTDAMVFPSCGEGFGWPPREYAGGGGAVAVTNWGGLADDLDQWGYPLPYRMVRAWESDKAYCDLGGRWAMADIDAIANWMVWYHDNRAMANEAAMESAKAIKRLYTWERFTTQVLRIWAKTCEGYYGHCTATRPTAS